MRKEMLKVLLNQNMISEEKANELENIDEDMILNSIKELGLKETDYVKTKIIKEKLNTTYIGNEIYCFNEVLSTNSIAKFLASTGTDEGAVVIAETQTNARGRSGKKWESPKGGVWLSLVLKPNVSPAKASLITLATGVAVAKTLRNIGADATIKWPNDVLIDGKKISGILTEANATFNSVDYVVVGVGIDTNLKIEEFPKELQKGATSLNNEVNEKVPENEIIARLLKEFEEVYDLFKEENFEVILKQWRELSDTIGKYVEIKQPLGRIYTGYAIGINQEGSLIIEEGDGNLEKIISGECRTKE